MQLEAVPILGPFPETNGNKHILTARDYFIRWMEAYPWGLLHTQDGWRPTHGDYFTRRMDGGLPTAITSHAGWMEAYSILNQKAHNNRTLQSILATAANKNGYQWEDHLRPLSMAYTPHVWAPSKNA